MAGACFSNRISNVDIETVGTLKMQIPPPGLCDSQIVNKVYYIFKGCVACLMEMKKKTCASHLRGHGKGKGVRLPQDEP